MFGRILLEQNSFKMPDRWTLQGWHSTHLFLPDPVSSLCLSDIAQLRKKFEEDKQKIALMRAQRKFRPYWISRCSQRREATVRSSQAETFSWELQGSQTEYSPSLPSRLWLVKWAALGPKHEIIFAQSVQCLQITNSQPHDSSVDTASGICLTNLISPNGAPWWFMMLSG